ncbi:uncharacterized protein LOC117113394, partial [Anneissia japonica]|uniref:uncharacterized protein LOC117113394 n=1 Tax=Anneissia japonica TaxID=1529436 RepID=UPI001425761C
MTNLQTIIFWIRSIYEYAILLHGLKEKPLINGIIASPTISLIGTHMDLLTGSDAEKQAKIDDMFDRIFKELEGTPYERHVDRERYAVDNTTSLDEGIQRLKRNVGGFMKAMARTVPINWMDFQIEVQEAGKTTLRMSLDKVLCYRYRYCIIRNSSNKLKYFFQGRRKRLGCSGRPYMLLKFSAQKFKNQYRLCAKI